MPHQLQFSKDLQPSTMINNRASWHHSCSNRWTASKLETAKAQSEKQRKHPLEKPPKRKSTEKAVCLCLFCGKSDNLTSFQTFAAEITLRRMAAEIGDESLQAKFPGKDFITARTMYHFNCLNSYKDCYFQTRVKKKPKDTKCKDAKDAAYKELFSYIATEIRKGTTKLKAKDLRKRCESTMKQNGIDIVLNKEYFANAVLEHFDDFGIQLERGWENTFTFPEEAHAEMEKIQSRVSDEEDEMMDKCAQIIRRELLQTQVSYNGSLINDSPLTSKTTKLVKRVLYGSEETSNEYQAVETITQLVHFNIKTTLPQSSKLRHSSEREPAVPTYIGLKIHNELRDRGLIESLFALGICINYKRVLNIENLHKDTILRQYDRDGYVCPTQLKKGSFVVGAIDNIDHNTSSTTAEGNFHGTGISLMQPNGNVGEDRATAYSSEPLAKDEDLPDNFRIVPAVSINNKLQKPSAKPSQWSPTTIEEVVIKEHDWLTSSKLLLEKEQVSEEDAISWSAFHAKQQDKNSNEKSIIATLPLFYEKSDSPAMVKHAMNLQKDVTEFINPGQTPVLACDQPIYSQGKFLQWKYPDLFKNMILLLGGMHIEKALWTAVGDLLESSGWCTVLTQAGIGGSGTSDSFLKCADICRTREAHQMTALALSELQEASYKIYVESSPKPEVSYSLWKSNMREYPTFLYWDLVLSLEVTVLAFVRSEREGDFDAYVSCLQSLMWLMFAFDHPNYARWLSVHIYDMLALDSATREVISKNWTIQKTNRRFSRLPIDQAHEQQNAIIKGRGGVIGLTENPAALNRWMMSGPEISRIVEEFDQNLMKSKQEEGLHHSENLSEQKRFQRKVKSLISAIDDNGNPFEEIHNDLIQLDTRDCATPEAIMILQNVQQKAADRYGKFVECVLSSNKGSIHDKITRMNQKIFKDLQKPEPSQDQNLKNNAALFGRMYIANQHRNGNLLEFFSHENQLSPPSISDKGKLRGGSKSKVLQCIGEKTLEMDTATFNCYIIDGGALLNILPTQGMITFDDFAKKVFISHLKQHLKDVDRLDVVWDNYHNTSIKSGTRLVRGKGSRRKVAPKTKMPTERSGSWKKFMREKENKMELIQLLTNTASNASALSSKWIVLSNGDFVTALGKGKAIPQSNLEEADARIILHLIDAVQNGFERICIRTVDSDVICIIIAHFERLLQLNSKIQISVSFATGKDLRLLDINAMVSANSPDMQRYILMFHTFTGCDTTSFFYWKGKCTFWKKMKAYPEITQAMCEMSATPFTPINEDSPLFKVFERYAIVTYDSSSNTDSINQCRLEVFARNKQDLFSCPPTRDALLQHLRRAIYQTGKILFACILHTVLLSLSNIVTQSTNINIRTLFKNTAITCKALFNNTTIKTPYVSLKKYCNFYKCFFGTLLVV